MDSRVEKIMNSSSTQMLIRHHIGRVVHPPNIFSLIWQAWLCPKHWWFRWVSGGKWERIEIEPGYVRWWKVKWFLIDLPKSVVVHEKEDYES